jgi:AcrR family transcriptional regulator
MTKRGRLGIEMRRGPASEEGRRIVHAILEAAERLLASERYEELSTNRIAEAAGVSIGSFYHYFPNKESVVAELARALDRRALELLDQRRELIAAASMRDAVHELVGVLFDARMGSVALRRQLLVHVPRDWMSAESARVDAQVQAFVCGFLRLRSHEADVRSAECATFVLFHAVEAVVEAAVASAPGLIEDGSLKRELTRLVLGYLGSATESGKRRSSVPPGPLSLPS